MRKRKVETTSSGQEVNEKESESEIRSKKSRTDETETQENNNLEVGNNLVENPPPPSNNIPESPDRVPGGVVRSLADYDQLTKRQRSNFLQPSICGDIKLETTTNEVDVVVDVFSCNSTNWVNKKKKNIDTNLISLSTNNNNRQLVDVNEEEEKKTFQLVVGEE